MCTCAIYFVCANLIQQCNNVYTTFRRKFVAKHNNEFTTNPHKFVVMFNHKFTTNLRKYVISYNKLAIEAKSIYMLDASLLVTHSSHPLATHSSHLL